MRKLSILLAVTALMCVSLCLSGCFGIYGKYDDQNSTAVRAVAAQSPEALACQAPEVLRVLAQVAEAVPVDPDTRQTITGYTAWANVAADTLDGVSTALSREDAASQAVGVATAVGELIQKAPGVDSQTRQGVADWSAWAVLAARAALTVLPLVAL